MVALAMASGCGSEHEDGASGGGAAGIDPETCRRAVGSLCQTRAACTAKDFAYGSVEACEEIFFSAMCEIPSYLQAGSELAGQILGPGYDECLRAQAALGPACLTPPTVTEADVAAARTACQPDKILPAPSRAIGEPCLVEHQCPRTATCIRPEKGCGTCEPVAEGKPCERARDCGTFTGFECSSKKVCTRVGQIGDACDERRCNPFDFLVCGNDKKCTTPAKRDEDCSVRPCDGALFLHCSAATKTCKPTPRKAGEPCMPDAVCGSGLFCNTTAGTCATLLLEGAPCGVAPGQDPCDRLQGLACDPQTVTCKLGYSRIGQPCEGSFPSAPDCWQSDCVASPNGGGGPGICTAYMLRGQACGDDRKCVEGLLCHQGKCSTVADTGILQDAGALGDAAAYQGCL